jgi:hypothetical protein
VPSLTNSAIPLVPLETWRPGAGTRLGVGSRRKRHSSILGTTRALAPSDRQRLGDRDLQTPEKEGVARGVTTRGEMSRVIKRQYTYLQGCNAQAVVSEDHIASAVIGPTAMMRSMKRGMPGTCPRHLAGIGALGAGAAPSHGCLLGRHPRA